MECVYNITIICNSIVIHYCVSERLASEEETTVEDWEDTAWVTTALSVAVTLFKCKI